MSTKTKAPAAPKKKGPTAIAFKKIAALEAKVAELTVGQGGGEQVATPAKYLATGRVTLPALGGLALPAGVGFHAYVETEFEDVADANGELHAPSREDVTAHLTKLADELHPNHVGVALCDVSVLPAGW